MSRFSQYLTVEQQEDIISSRLSQHAAEGFQHEINLAIAQASGNEEMVKASEDAIAAISAAIEVEQSQLFLSRSGNHVDSPAASMSPEPYGPQPLLEELSQEVADKGL